VYFYANLERSAPRRAWDDVDRRIADAASSYLVNFAQTGDPNRGAHARASLPAWPAFTGRGAQALHLGDTIEAAAVPDLPALDFYDAFYTHKLGRPLPFP
jgi:para-nitrobenzyl esterase